MEHIVTKKRIENLISEALNDCGHDPARYTTKPGPGATDEVSAIWFYVDGRPCGIVKIGEGCSVRFDNSVIDDSTPELDMEWQGISGVIRARLIEFLGWANLQGEGAAGDIVLQSGEPGRPRDPLYNEAAQRIRSGQPEKEVFKWFCQESRIEKPDKSVRDAFKSAIKRRQNNS